MNLNSEKLNIVLEAVAEAIHQQGYKEIVCFDDCVNFYRECKLENPDIRGFVISVKKNYDPRNENDKFVVIQGMIDENNHPITLGNQEGQSRIIHTKTVDKKMVDFLNGEETKVVKERK